MTSDPKPEAEAAAELMKAMTRLRARLRRESAPGDMQWTWSQLTTLGRIVTEGSVTASELAQAEHVRRQSMAETLAALRVGGLIDTSKDPGDGRKTLIHATPEGRALIETIPAARVSWLGAVIEAHLRADERETLLKAAAIMNRLADSDS
ncbi:MarR family winged helix-turn-helix transcriptional regulator [Streptomyces sp. NBC_00038]|uniref:MarR family winged helix-turn-helix transcriptional regulator n=1 Tax=Streptomyces sp. NBC_00038 TaxID=2903615 RepID=UPI002254477A|nr:MarR family transcriptional regulator [Streptomyces sp. NBC_00038]MCX5555583.1 MarR family transcriptional regulator [Streptomyces sp. NBC_00038]